MIAGVTVEVIPVLEGIFDFGSPVACQVDVYLGAKFSNKVIKQHLVHLGPVMAL